MLMKRNMVAFDCGNSSCRVILGVYDGEQITTEVISRIPNYMVRVHQYFYWDILMIYQKLLEGLKEAVKRAGTIHSIGICTWGVDFALFDKQGLMIQNPLSYRNGIGAEVLEQMSEEQRTYLFGQTGILCDKINSVNMIKGMMEKMQSIVFCGHKLLMIPDILNYLFTGRMVNEPSELSTTQLMDARKRELSEEVLRTMEIPSGLFAAIGKHGTAIGMLHSNVNEEVRKRCLTNEIGAFNKITLLRNSAGMFIIQRIKEEYEGEHGNIGWEELNSLGDRHEGIVPLFPVNDTSFFNPVHMSDEIWNYFVKTGQASGEKDWGTIICGFQNSMALSFASVIQDLEEISGKKKDTVYMVGGGSRNARLCQMTADAAGKRVVTGGKESTSLGNLGAQLKYFEPDLTVREIRSLLGKGIESTTYCRGKDSGEALKRYQKLEG